MNGTPLEQSFMDEFSKSTGAKFVDVPGENPVVEKKERRGGARANAGRKPYVERLKLSDIDKDKKFKSTKAEFWVDLAENVALPRLRRILETGEDGAAARIGIDICNRAYGKPIERVEHSGEINNTATVELSDKNVAELVTQFEEKLRQEISK